MVRRSPGRSARCAPSIGQDLSPRCCCCCCQLFDICFQQSVLRAGSSPGRPASRWNRPIDLPASASASQRSPESRAPLLVCDQGWLLPRGTEQPRLSWDSCICFLQRSRPAPGFPRTRPGRLNRSRWCRRHERACEAPDLALVETICFCCLLLYLGSLTGRLSLPQLPMASARSGSRAPAALGSAATSEKRGCLDMCLAARGTEEVR
mmetsp:Transcript_42865/g.77453  ORF Transcript_42865/g.77453 Transcript_42865/m.77453 type:complete len:207 (+) Transcript_42865:568-1188(+)